MKKAKNKKNKNLFFFRNIFFLCLATFNGLLYTSNNDNASQIGLIILFSSFIYVLIFLRNKIKLINYLAFVLIIVGSKYKIDICFYNFFNISSVSVLLFQYFYKRKNLINMYSSSTGNLTIQAIDDFKNLETTKQQSDAFENLIRDYMGQWNTIKTAYTTGDLRKIDMLPTIVSSTGGSGEQGMDVVCFFKNPQLINKAKYDGLAIQAKHYQDKVGNNAIQEIHSATKIYSSHYRKKLYPIVISNSTFSKDAILLAQKLGIKIIDRELLIPFLKGDVKL